MTSEPKASTAALLTAQETENRTIARELHDVASQELAAITLELTVLQKKLRNDPDIANQVASLVSRIARLAQDLHQASRQLHPAIVEEFGLEMALRHECQSFEQWHEIPAEFTATNLPPTIPSDIALSLYRVAQECLRNVQKHSSSPKVRVSLRGKKQGIALQVDDAGHGFDLEPALRRGGLGLVSMDERMRLVGGKLTIEAKPGDGTRITAFAPLRSKQ